MLRSVILGILQYRAIKTDKKNDDFVIFGNLEFDGPEYDIIVFDEGNV